ncbi:hypothetical protein A2U01_0040009 [Trifolium medium]|uniref:Uncharacterized protein n=1 Tax=Trifolium medium TaxID=97028 RepID=A0A392Q419_9FABA|nr:hypothetical protein [Trifolium medium]
MRQYEEALRCSVFASFSSSGRCPCARYNQKSVIHDFPSLIDLTSTTMAEEVDGDDFSMLGRGSIS